MMAYLQQIRDLFLRLSMRQRILIGGAAVLVIGLIIGLRYWQTERNFKPLFHQELSAEDAGMVLAKLKEAGVEVRLENGGKVIKVPADKADELRIQMATAGLPKSGRTGFELFDKTTFGTSEYVEQIQYHRAMEGELERSVMSLQEVESARVHITFPEKSLFLENKKPAKASVLLKLKLGSNLTKENVRAITHLTSSAVDGLTPENVSVLDMHGNLLSRTKKDGDADDEATKQLTEYRENMEQNLREKIRVTLEPLLGADGFRAAVSLECDLASGDQSEESFDPTRSVLGHAQRSEDGSTPAGANGVPGTASNLPRPTSRPGSGSGNPTYRRSEEQSFQNSRIIRHIKFPHGQIKHLSASVLLDHIVKTEGGKRIVEEPTEERLRGIKEIVSAAVGAQEERGDKIVVVSAAFESTRNTEPVVAAPAPPARPRLYLPTPIPAWLRVPMEGHLNWLIDQNWLPAAVIVMVLGILYGLFRVVKAIGGKMAAVGKSVVSTVGSKLPFGKKKKGQHVDVTMDPSVEGGHTAGQLEAGHGGSEGTVHKPLHEQLRERDQLQEQLTQDAMMELEVPKPEVRRGEVLSRHIVDMAEKDPHGVAALLRTWLEGNGG